MKYIIWIKDNILAVLIAVIAMMGAGIFWSYHRGKIRSFEYGIEVQKAFGKIEKINVEIERLEVEKDTNSEMIDELRKRRIEIQREMVSIEQDIIDMSNEEIESAFRRLY
jgi:hypothetical protein